MPEECCRIHVNNLARRQTSSFRVKERFDKFPVHLKATPFMRTNLKVVFFFGVLSLWVSCDNGNDEVTEAVSISNLEYSPDTYAYNRSGNLIVSGTFQFRNARRGISTLWLRTSPGDLLELPMEGVIQENGTLSGSSKLCLPDLRCR
jgi:hypothetical protein